MCASASRTRTRASRSSSNSSGRPASPRRRLLGDFVPFLGADLPAQGTGGSSGVDGDSGAVGVQKGCAGPLWPGGTRRQPRRGATALETVERAGHDLNGRHSRSVDDDCGWWAGHPCPAGTDSRGRTGAQLGTATGDGAPRRPTAPLGIRGRPARTRVRGARHRPTRSPARGRLPRWVDSVDHRRRCGSLGHWLGGRGDVGVARDDASLLAQVVRGVGVRVRSGSAPDGPL